MVLSIVGNGFISLFQGLLGDNFRIGLLLLNENLRDSFGEWGRELLGLVQSGRPVSNGLEGRPAILGDRVIDTPSERILQLHLEEVGFQKGLLVPFLPEKARSLGSVVQVLFPFRLVGLRLSENVRRPPFILGEVVFIHIRDVLQQLLDLGVLQAQH